jgi:hypothetical protein
MKVSNYLLSAFAALGTLASANAQTVINITGSTAFRQAVHESILDALSGEVYGMQTNNLGNAGRAIFRGNLTVSGTPTDVIVRTSWSGSVAGVRALTSGNESVSYYSSTNSTLLNSLSANGTQSISTSGSYSESTTSNFICFSDNLQSNTPYTSPSLTSTPVGALIFQPVSNNSSAITANSSISTAQLRTLITNGKVQMKYITGNTSDHGKMLYWTGRNSLSGTRVIYLSETGIGASQPVKQYRAQSGNMTDKTSAITALRYWPVEASNNGVNVWDATQQSGNATAGNGGYDSGGTTANVMCKPFASGNISIEAADATVDGTIADSSVALMTVLSSQEIPDIRTGGGKPLAYNGVLLSPTSWQADGTGGLQPADQDKIINGQYTFWSNVRLMRTTGRSATETALINALITQLPLNIKGNGVKSADMKVSRTTDGGIISVAGSMQ